MRVEYTSNKVEKVCTSKKEASKLFGGDTKLAIGLLARINALEQADTLKDIILSPPFHFHKLRGDYNGFFAIDVKSRRSPWRIILEPLNDDGEPFVPCNIDEIANIVRIIEIKEVSNHYE